MKNFHALAIYLVPLTVIAVCWAEMLFTDEVHLLRVISITAVVAACLCWCIKDWRYLDTLRPILVGGLLGSVLAIVVIGPTIASRRTEAVLEEMKRTDPGTYAFTVGSTAIIPLGESSRRYGLRIAVPIGVLAGLFIGSIYAGARNRMASRQTTTASA